MNESDIKHLLPKALYEQSRITLDEKYLASIEYNSEVTRSKTESVRKARKRTRNQAIFDESLLQWDETHINKSYIECKSKRKSKVLNHGKENENFDEKFSENSIKDANIAINVSMWESPSKYKRHKSDLTSPILNKGNMYDSNMYESLDLSCAGEIIANSAEPHNFSILSPWKDKILSTPHQERFKNFGLIGSSIKPNFIKPDISIEGKLHCDSLLKSPSLLLKLAYITHEEFFWRIG